MHAKDQSLYTYYRLGIAHYTETTLTKYINLCRGLRLLWCLDIAIVSVDNPIMAKRQYASDWKLISRRLAPHDVPELEAFADQHNGDLLAVVERFAQHGYKLSFRFVSDQAAWCVTVSGTPESLENNRASLVSWSDHLVEATMMAGYKHFVIFKGGRWLEDGNNDRWG